MRRKIITDDDDEMHDAPAVKTEQGATTPNPNGNGEETIAQRKAKIKEEQSVKAAAVEEANGDDEMVTLPKKTNTTTTAAPKPPTPRKRRIKPEINDDDDDGDSSSASDFSAESGSSEESESSDAPETSSRARARSATPKKAPTPRKTTTKKVPVKREESESESESEDEKPKKKTPAKKTPVKKAATPRKATKKEEEETPKKRGTKRKKEEDEEDQKGKGKRVKKEEEPVFKWWEEENQYEDGVKWRTLEHNGVLFPPEYVPHGIPVKYKGKPVKLTPEQEEVATMFASMRESDYYTKPVFKKNFFEDWKELLGKNHVIKNLEDCDFTDIWNHYQNQQEEKKNKSKEEKKREKEEKDKREEIYTYAFVDGRKEKIGNFRIEPPGLFRGRGDHPKMGKLKKRIQPEDVTINIGEGVKVPEPPEGHEWKAVVHNNKVTWLAMWRDTVNNDFKYVLFAASSSFRGKADWQKFETARKLSDHIDAIRKRYTEEWDDEDERTRQRATALYFIDRLALRVGNEKDEDEADTVGCCSLRIEHIKLKEPDNVEFDFLGKDSIRYNNTVKVPKKVFANLKRFSKGKKPTSDLFDQLTTSSLNAYLKTLMDKLTAKVFRTFNASRTLQQELAKEMTAETIAEKIAFYNEANRQVAILCNHQRAPPKTFSAQMQKAEEKINELEEKLEAMKKARDQVKKKGYDAAKAKWDKDFETEKEQFEDALEQWTKKTEELKANKAPKAEKDAHAQTKPVKPTKVVFPKEDKFKDAIDKLNKKINDLKVQKKMKEDNSRVALGTSKINYLDPRITIAWCKKNQVPVEKIFNKSLLTKFPWARDADEDFEF